MFEEICDVIIIGSGPAGYTAGIYASRAMLKTVLVTGYSIGGQLMTTSEVENFPGYLSVSGPDIMNDLRKQAEKFGTKLVFTSVKSIDTETHASRKLFGVRLDMDTELLTRSIIIATGAEAKWLNLENELPLRNNGLSACAVCDGAFFKEDHVICIGGGDCAMEEAIFLTKYASKVTIIHRSDNFRASKIMLERARKNPKIEWLLNSTVTKWCTDESGYLVGAIVSIKNSCENFSSCDSKLVECSGAFMGIGHTPNTKFLSKVIDLDSDGYILLKENTMTNIPGIFACGDCVDKKYRQGIVASAQGCMSAMDCEKWLEE